MRHQEQALESQVLSRGDTRKIHLTVPVFKVIFIRLINLILEKLATLGTTKFFFCATLEWLVGAVLTVVHLLHDQPSE